MISIEPPRSRPDADSWNDWQLSRPALTRFARRAQTAAGLEGNVDILLAGDATLRRLNRDFRGKDQPTDVLSFPAPQELAAIHGGDLAISLATARRQAKEHGHELADELRILILHGMLHLAGMDHETDRGQMAARESELRQTLKLPNSLIDRVTNPSTAKPARKKAATR